MEGEDGRFFPQFLVELGLSRSALCFGDFGAWRWGLGLGLFELFLLGVSWYFFEVCCQCLHRLGLPSHPPMRRGLLFWRSLCWMFGSDN